MEPCPCTESWVCLPWLYLSIPWQPHILNTFSIFNAYFKFGSAESLCPVIPRTSGPSHPQPHSTPSSRRHDVPSVFLYLVTASLLHWTINSQKTENHAVAFHSNLVCPKWPSHVRAPQSLSTEGMNICMCKLVGK